MGKPIETIMMSIVQVTIAAARLGVNKTFPLMRKPITIGTEISERPASAEAVAYAAKAIAKSSRTEPSIERHHTGRAISLRYCVRVAPREEAALNHSLFNPAIAGSMSTVTKGIWKYR